MNTEIASKLLALRKQNGFSQEELAEKLNVSRQAVSKWERGEASPDTENLIALARLYGISLDRLFGIDSEPVSERSVINLEKKTENETEGFSSSVIKDGMKVMYPDTHTEEEIYISPEQKSTTAYQEKPYKEADEDYSTYFKYETVDDTVSAEKLQFQEKSGLNSMIETYRSLEDKIRNDNRFYKKLMRFPYPLAVTGLFLYAGSLWNLWHPLWMTFLTIPLYYTGIQAIRHKNANIFCYPVAVVLLYLSAGFAFRMWHPGWLAFLTIPIYYWLINSKDRDKDEKPE